MNYKKIGQELYERGYVDGRYLMCHSNATVATGKDYGLFATFTTYSQKNLPSFMILSIKDDKLHISHSKMFGGFKAYYGYIELGALKYLNTERINAATDMHQFICETDNGKFNFQINVTQKKDEGQKLVNAIIDYQKRKEFL